MTHRPGVLLIEEEEEEREKKKRVQLLGNRFCSNVYHEAWKLGWSISQEEGIQENVPPKPRRSSGGAEADSERRRSMHWFIFTFIDF